MGFRDGGQFCRGVEVSMNWRIFTRPGALGRQFRLADLVRLVHEFYRVKGPSIALPLGPALLRSGAIVVELAQGSLGAKSPQVGVDRDMTFTVKCAAQIVH